MMKILPRIIRPMSNVVLVMWRKTEVELTSVMFRRKKKKFLVSEREKISCVLIHSKVRKVLKKFILRSSTAGFLPFLPLFSGDDCFLIDPGGVGASFFFCLCTLLPLSLSLIIIIYIFFFLVRTSLMGKVGDGFLGMPFCRDFFFEEKEFEIVAYVLWFV